MASSSLFLLLTVVAYVSAVDNMMCIMLECTNPNVLNNPVLLNQCKRFRCNVPQIGPSPIRMPFQPPNIQFSPYGFAPVYIPARMNSLDFLLAWATHSGLFSESDIQAWRHYIIRIGNETNIQKEDWSKSLKAWYKANADVQEFFKNVSRIISKDIETFTNLKGNLLKTLGMPIYDHHLKNFLEEHLVYQAPTTKPYWQGYPPYVDLPPFAHFPPIQSMPPMLNSNFDQFGFPLSTVHGPVYSFGPQKIPRCLPAARDEKIKVTFDVLVGNRSRCNADIEEPKQKLKNMLILAAHSHSCLVFTTMPSNVQNKKVEMLYTVDGIARTNNNKWVIKLKSTGAQVDLNTYVPSDGDYYYIDYTSAIS